MINQPDDPIRYTIPVGIIEIITSTQFHNNSGIQFLYEEDFDFLLSKAERKRFEDLRAALSDEVCRKYDEAQTFHDGKWIMFEPEDASEFDEYLKLLAIERKPNRK